MPTIYISIGSNQDAERQVRYGLKQLSYFFSDLHVSHVYESEAVGFEGDNFLNLVASARTQMTISQVDHAFKRIEKQAGRVRGGEKFSNRTLDIDLLLYDDIVCEKPIRLPRDEVLYHAFVLQPLAEIAPNLVHPVEGKTYETLWQAFRKKEEQKLWAIDFDWGNGN
ncbi:2-amino-4-hydroxy-6-hydroxymethyldihydropteridine diphosphokinase [Kangiella sediminilitoris]|uniref:2-amino-4-hydroxy-6-hydroxymethyldihydropteridine diphosphokinase n=1 Tax=Kangiella sediminilitoris TaxID=1144748 RepID=A0A1B3B8Q1_9GAMM|nr:2-amino-4-hydroxy-6-hydroxymethyldihydropteridine diphosphokinase [Kangiella sediminilitoris]AOE49150.1 2-amino-4-hydroxy-6-hydroxymethyldihydropteridine pyrophosphokinase [Kangiella sediminilitoris]